MFIKFKPTDEAFMGTVNTNLGEYTPGKVGGPFTDPQTIAEAKRLVANGEFVECDAGGEEVPGGTSAEVLEPEADPEAEHGSRGRKSRRSE